MYDGNGTNERLDLIADMAGTLAERLLTRTHDLDDTAHAQRLLLMRVAILLNDMDFAIPDNVLEAIEAAETAMRQPHPSEYDDAARASAVGG